MNNKTIAELIKVANDFPVIHGGDGAAGTQVQDRAQGQQAANDSKNQSPNDDPNNEDPGDDGEGDGDDDGQDEAAKKALRDQKLAKENARRRVEAKELKRQVEELQQQLEERDERQTEDQVKAKTDSLSKKLQKADKERAILASTNEKLLLEMAVLKDENHKWYDSSAVIALLDTSYIDLDPASGTIEGIEDALEELAREKPFLVKPSQKRNSNSGSSGNQPGAGSSNRQMTEQQQRDAIAKKWKLN